MSPEVVQNQQRCITYLVEELVIGHFTIGIKRCPQVVEKVRGSDIESRKAVIDALIDDSRRQMGLTAAAGTAQNQPTLRLGGECFSCLVSTTELLLAPRIAAFSTRLHVVKGQAG